jgi:hypothetical protein
MMACHVRKNSTSSVSISKWSRLSKRQKLSDSGDKEENKSDFNISSENKPWILVANDDRFLLEMI